MYHGLLGPAEVRRPLLDGLRMCFTCLVPAAASSCAHSIGQRNKSHDSFCDCRTCIWQSGSTTSPWRPSLMPRFRCSSRSCPCRCIPGEGLKRWLPHTASKLLHIVVLLSAPFSAWREHACGCCLARQKDSSPLVWMQVGDGKTAHSRSSPLAERPHLQHQRSRPWVRGGFDVQIHGCKYAGRWFPWWLLAVY